MAVDRASSRGARRRARELVVQALYQSLVGEATAEELQEQFKQRPGADKADQDYFTVLLLGVLERREALEAFLKAGLDRPVAQLDPVERAILLLAAYELRHRSDVPARVSINEAVELAKRFGAEEGHAYVNAVLDRVARDCGK